MIVVYLIYRVYFGKLKFGTANIFPMQCCCIVFLCVLERRRRRKKYSVVIMFIDSIIFCIPLCLQTFIDGISLVVTPFAKEINVGVERCSQRLHYAVIRFTA